ncbi:MAG: hypothetical protein AAF647_10020, partial [Pseudomonadota bacterium]
TKRQSLSGPWMGPYNYLSPAVRPVAFNALLADDDGDISGETIEPNTFSDLDHDTLMAGIIGVREGTWLRFTKSYSDFSSPRIDYAGRVNSKFTRVDGTWSFPSAPWERGTFVLIRDAVAVDADVRRARLTTQKLTLRRL